MSVIQEIHNETDGRIIIPGFKKGVGAFDEGGWVNTAAQAVSSYMTQGARTSENAFFDVEQRIHKSTAMLSLIGGSTYQEAKAESAYRGIDFNSDLMKKQMNLIGYGTAQQEKTKALLNGATFNVASGNVPSQQHLDALKKIALSNQQMRQLETTGSFKLNAVQIQTMQNQGLNMKDLQDQNIQITAWSNGNSTTPEEVKDQIRLARQESERREAIVGRHGRAGTNEALHTLRGAQIAYLSSKGGALQGFTGNESHKKMLEIRETLNKQLNDAIGKENNVLAAEIQNEIEIFDSFESVGQQADKSGYGQSKRSYGRSIVTRGMIGDDFRQGQRFWKHTANITRTATRVAFHGTIGAASTLGAHVAGGIQKYGANNENKLLENQAEQIKDSLTNVKAKNKQAYKAGKTRKGAKQYRRELTNKAIIGIHTKNNDRREAEIAKLKGKNKARSPEEDRRLRKLERKKDASDRRIKTYSSVLQGYSDTKKNLKAAFQTKIDEMRNSKLGRALSAPWRGLSALKGLLQTAKKKLAKFGILGAGVAIIMIVITSVIQSCFLIISAYFSSDSYLDELNKINYVQLIVDQVSASMGTEYINIAKTDAYNHFLKLDPSEYDDDIEPVVDGWSISVREPEIGDITSTPFEDENGDITEIALPGVNANLLPIVSMMHARYNDSINFDNYYTALGYTYFMYAQSHHGATVLYDEDGNVVTDEDGNPIEEGYRYEISDPHDDDKLYSNGSDFTYNVNTGAVFRGYDICDNIYIHGYDPNVSLKFNERRAALHDFFVHTILALVSDETLDDLGVRLDEVGVMTPQELVDLGCTNYTVVEGKKNCEHIHTDECKKLICTATEHKHTKACYTGKGKNKKLTCKISEHTHTDACYDYSNCKHVCKHLVTSTDANGNITWNDDSCYEVVGICKGHCGGHITPIIDVTIDYDWENLCKLDAYKTTYFLTKSEIFEDEKEQDIITFFGNIFGKMNTVAEWQEYWNRKCSAWFTPCPRSFYQVYSSAINTIYHVWVHADDWVHDKIQGLFGFGNETPDEDELETMAANIKDLYGWNGWFLDDGETINPDQLSLLKGLYGTPDDSYASGIEMWEGFEVVFPIGVGRVLSNTQKTEIIEQVKATWARDHSGAEIPSARLAVIKEALDKIGCYYYDLNKGHANGLSLTSTGGASECSGFVGGVLRRAYVGLDPDNINKLTTLDATTDNYTCTASTYCQKANTSNRNAGDIIAHNNGGKGYTGHVLIYLGYLDSGIDGYAIVKENGDMIAQEGGGYYVIHCTSGKGSVLQKKSVLELNKIPYTYVPVFY